MLPNFLLIGAAKAGTTSLHRYLGQHPEIFMSRIKEPGFFVFEGTNGRAPMIRFRPFITDAAAYESLFRKGDGSKVRGESSPQYLDFASPTVIQRIQAHLSDVRLIAVLRQPVDQAYSRYIMWKRGGHGPGVGFRKKFLQDLSSYHDLTYDFNGEEALVKSYHDRLRLYLDAFGQERIRVLLYDDLVRDPQSFLRRIYRFLGVDPRFRNDFSVKANKGGLYRSRSTSALMTRPNPIRWVARRIVPDEVRVSVRRGIVARFSKPAPKLRPALRKELTSVLADEIRDLELLTGYDLAAWRRPRRPGGGDRQGS